MNAPDLPSLAYQYVVLRCVPRVDRDEFLNVGVVVYCHATDYLAAAWEVDVARLGSLGPGLDVEALRGALHFVDAVCAASPAGGAAASASTSQRFGFLKAPRSTVVQPGPVHGGLCADPAQALAALLAAQVGIASAARPGQSQPAQPVG